MCENLSKPSPSSELQDEAYVQVLCSCCSVDRTGRLHTSTCRDTDADTRAVSPSPSLDRPAAAATQAKVRRARPKQRQRRPPAPQWPRPQGGAARLSPFMFMDAKTCVCFNFTRDVKPINQPNRCNIKEDVRLGVLAYYWTFMDIILSHIWVRKQR